MKIGFEGRFSLVASGGARGTVELAEFNNNITNIGLDRIGVGSIATNCRVGAGNTPPTDGDTNLVAHRATSDSIIGNTTWYENVVPPRSAVKRTYRFSKGIAAGTHSEVGIGWGGNGDNLWSRALIKDENGNPLSITILSDEVLDVYYTLFMYLDTTDDIKNFTYKDVVRKATTRWYNVGQNTFMLTMINAGISFHAGNSWPSATIGGANSVLGSIYTNPTLLPNSVSTNTRSIAAYVNGSRERTSTWIFGDTLNITGNRIGVFAGHVIYNTDGYNLLFKTQFEPPLEKDYTEEFTYTGKISWGRYVPPVIP